MKKILFALLGLVLALLAVTVVVHLDLVTIWIGFAFAYGAFRAFRAAFRPRQVAR